MSTLEGNERIRAETIRMQIEAGGSPRLVIHGNSMLPFLVPGEAVYLEGVRRPRRGMIAAFESPRGIAVHRIVGFHRGQIVLKGDNSICFDPPVQRLIGVAVRTDEQRIQFGKWARTAALVSWVHGQCAQALLLLRLPERWARKLAEPLRRLMILISRGAP